MNKTQQEASNTTQQQLSYSLPDTLFIDKMEPEYIQLRNNDSFANRSFYANKNNKFMRQQNLDNIILLDKYSALTNVSTMRMMKYNVDNEFHTLTDYQSKEIIQILNKAKYLRLCNLSLESDLDTYFLYIAIKSDAKSSHLFRYWPAHHIISIGGHLYSVEPLPI